jgi:hypothetical protein
LISGGIAVGAPHPEYMLVRQDGRLSVGQRPRPKATEPEGTSHGHVGTAAPGCPAEQSSTASSAVPTEKKPATSAAEVCEKITGMIRENLPELMKVYNEGMKKEAEEQAMKKQPQKESLPGETEKNFS